MNIAILGTRGIPNNYGGFEQFTQYLAEGLVEKKHTVTVYSPHNHKYKNNTWRSVKIKHIFDPTYKIGTVGQFVYDFLSILDTRKQKYDIVLQLGYTSSAIFFGLHPKHSIVVTNMDGLEWKRSKYSKKVQMFLKYSERLAVLKSDFLVSDSIGIQNYLGTTYEASSVYIPYGSDVFHSPDFELLQRFNLSKFSYNILIARLVPENSIETILEGSASSSKEMKLLVVGNYESNYAQYLKEKFMYSENIVFLGGIYDIELLNNLRYFSNLYFHGHTVGGTNPSLLEAMASSALICAHKNEFNEAILGKDAFYFEEPHEISNYITNIEKKKHLAKCDENIKKIEAFYTWQSIITQYENLFLDIYAENKT